MTMQELWADFGWFFQLGYVVVIAVLLTMALTQLWKVTILKKLLKKDVKLSEDPELNEKLIANRRDKILGLAGTITSIVTYVLVYFANEMILNKTFFIWTLIDWKSEWFWTKVLTSGAVVWVAAKGLYTVLHKFVDRCKDKKLTKQEIADTKEDIKDLKEKVEQAQAEPKILDKPVGSSRGKKIL